MPATRVAYIDGKINYGRGRAAAVLGQTYTVQRLSPTTNGSITNNSPVYVDFPARLRRTTRKIAIENETFSLLVYEAECDPTYLQLQDVLTETGYKSDGGVYTFAQHRPTREVLWMRTEATCTITRPMPRSGQSAQQPTSGPTAVPGWGGITKMGEQILQLANGSFTFQAEPPANQVATVQCGLQPLNRIRDTSSTSPAGKMPTALYREHFLVYVPELPGVMLNELDRINAPGNDRYEIMLYENTDGVGLTGFVCIAEKIST